MTFVKQDLMGAMPGLEAVEVPEGTDLRACMMHSALVGAMAVITGCSAPAEQQTMNAKDKETSKSGLAVSMALC